MKTVKINVTQRDLKRGFRTNSRCCPVALAARRHKGWEEARVGAGTIAPKGWHITKGSFSLSLPQEAQQFILDYDQGRAVKPFSFTVKVPE